jgi:hypothetical protein
MVVKLQQYHIHSRETVKSDVFTAGLVFGYYLLGGDHTKKL